MSKIKLHLDGYAGEHETEGGAIMDDDGHLLITTVGWYAFKQDWKAYTGFAESVVERYNSHARLTAENARLKSALEACCKVMAVQTNDADEGESYYKATRLLLDLDTRTAEAVTDAKEEAL